MSKGYVAYFLVLLLFIYIVMSFLNSTFNPMEWHPFMKLLTVIAIFIGWNERD